MPRDGSPIDTGVVPSMPLPRRMFAGERLRFHRPIRIGDAVRRETELADIAVKTAGTGTFNSHRIHWRARHSPGRAS